ncbi:DUF4038 domain-containing protein [Alteromonas sp. ASW11-36]|uniref:DUF4038 domain-containing protein n=1 Tax=Alteromonas arenosi TaxID=3055817 RepID=A0ABT7SX22_9ALTE|nr:DUF5060 domain-containing protein [Alteromonas sp. ASW11-36]MDM7860554.1 DUF4038 domain-containing protein [Alteromonas sp. ASW11-36]
MNATTNFLNIRIILLKAMCLLLLIACGGSSTEDPDAVTVAPPETPVEDQEFDPYDGLHKNMTIDIAGVNREYHLWLPDDTYNAPVVFIFHGHNNDYNGIIGLDEMGNPQPVNTFPYKTWLEVAHRENIILVVPNGFNDGNNKGWNDCRGDSVGNSEQDDVAFVSQLIDHLVSEYQAAPRRIFATGTSNGGHMSIRLGQELTDKVAAFAAVSAANPVNTECTELTKPISALFMNGTDDPILPYQGGQMIENRGEVYSTEATVAYWVARNQLSNQPVETNLPDSFTDDASTVTKVQYSDSASDTEVVLFQVNGGGHASPSPTQRFGTPYVPHVLGEQNGDIEMAEEVWQFFQDKELTDNLATKVYQIYEKTFYAENSYNNPYLDVDLWVMLTGPGVEYRVPAFWDGGNTFRVRLVATHPGAWFWSTESVTGDAGLDNKSGSFVATEWNEQEKLDNPNRRGFLKVSNRVLEYADGTPFFMTVDTKSTLLTDIFRWDSGNIQPGLAGVSFQDAVIQRKSLGFNTFQVISSFPSDRFDELWQQVTWSKKHAEDGSWPFKFLAADPSDGFEHPDFSRINPNYWQQLDRKFQFITEQGMIFNLEVLRRSEQQFLEAGPEVAAAFIRYLWARYGGYNMVFSWMHIDASMTPASSEHVQLVHDYIELLTNIYDRLGNMPFGNPKTIMVPWGTTTSGPLYDLALDQIAPNFIDLNSYSNTERKGGSVPAMRNIFQASPLPVINLEPYWPTPHAFFSQHDFLTMEQQAQFLMYASVLNGGAVMGHTWGDGFFTGIISETTRLADNLEAYQITTMGHLKRFMQDEGHDFSVLMPTPENLDYSMSSQSSLGGESEFHSLATTPQKDIALGFIAATFDSVDLINMQPSTTYSLEWFDIQSGEWLAQIQVDSDDNGRLEMPAVPNNELRGWAFRLSQY